MKMRIKKFTHTFLPHLLFIFSLIIAFYGDIPTFIEKEFKINIQNIILGLIIIIYYIYLIINVHSDLGVNGEKVKTTSDEIINIIILSIINIYIIITFIPNPNFIENWANISNSLTFTQTITGTKPCSQTPTPDPSGTALQTETIQPPTSTSISTLTPTPTLKPTPTPTPINYAINVCVFELGLDENNEPIVKTNVDNLERLGFNVKIINIAEKSSYDGCQVLYLSDGWINLRGELENGFITGALKEELEKSGGPGLLIGNPGKNYDDFTLNLFTPIKFESLSDEEIKNLAPSRITAQQGNPFFDTLLKDLSNDSIQVRNNLPVPESKIYITPNDSYGINALIFGGEENDSTYTRALVCANEGDDLRYIIMPGGEFSSRYPIPNYLFERFIKWLARIPIN